MCLLSAGRQNEAIECGRRALEIDPNFHLVLIHMGLAQLGAGKPEDAVGSFRRAREVAPWVHVGAGCLAAAYYSVGDYERSNEIAGQFVRPGSLHFGHAVYYAAAGEADAMFEALEGAYGRRDLYLLFVGCVRQFDPYREDPRFRNLLRKMNLVD